MLNYQVIQSDDWSAQDKPSIFFLHGLFGDASNWLGIAKQLVTKMPVQCILIDLPAHGESPTTPLLDYASMSEAVHSTITALIDQGVVNSGNLNVLGHSMGGKVAMQLALQLSSLSSIKPLTITKLIVVDIAPVEYDLIHTPIIDAMQAIERKVDTAGISSRKDADVCLAECVKESDLRAFLMKGFKRVDGRWAWRFDLLSIAQGYASIAGFPAVNTAVGCFSAPVMVIKGANSDYIQAKDQPHFEALFPNLTFKLMQGAGHWPHAEKPQAFVSLIKNFIEL